MSNWSSISKSLLEDKDFGIDMNANNSWLDASWSSGLSSAKNKKEEAMLLFKYVQNTFKCKGNNGIYIHQPLKQTFTNKSGYTSDINLLLTMLFLKKGFQANPLILSTRSHVFVNEVYPLLNEFNYVICKVVVDGKPYFLDASATTHSFNKLPSYCYNGVARNISMNTCDYQQYFISDFPSNQFNHVIVCVPKNKDTTW